MKKTPRRKACSICKVDFDQYQSTQVVCSPRCALELATLKAAKRRAKETRQMRREFNAKDRSYQLKKAQEAFNAFIRERDSGQGCISCGIQTGQFHAGHFVSVGHGGSGLRFSERNCNLQCAQCNTYKSGNIALYRANLVKKIGLGDVDELESTKAPIKLTLEEIIEIKETYRAKLKALRQEKAA